MALIEKFHVVAAEQAVAAGQTIKEGQVVSLNTTSQVVLQGTVISGDANSPYQVPYGIAGDTKSTTGSSMPGINSGWQNRPSDYYDETKASGKMTVYHSGGEFATDQFAANVATAAIMTALYGVNGLLETSSSMSNVVVARLVQSADTYPSGVPGIDINGDQALSGDDSGAPNGSGGNTYVEIKLVI